MSDEDLDARLAAYLLSHPPPKAKAQWVKPALAALSTIVGASWGANAYLSKLATKEYIDSLRSLDAAARKDDLAHEHEQDARISNAEMLAGGADKCCSQQSQRLDRFTTPSNIQGYR